MTGYIKWLDRLVWGPWMLALLLGTGIFLTVRTRFLPWRNLGWALRGVVSQSARARPRDGGVSPFSALMTALAATVGTGNIVGVATALVSGGPGALVWMELSAAFGLSSKLTECLLAVKYRTADCQGRPRGGPMYTMERAIHPRRLGALLAVLFSLCALLASFGIGGMTQAHSIAGVLSGVPARVTGAVTALLTLAIILGGIGTISAVSAWVVPAMALLYLSAALAVILGHLPALPSSIVTMLRMAFSPAAAAGGMTGTLTASALDAVRWGVARGCFSNEAGLGSAAITAAAAATDAPARQGYISMTGTFFDTMVICTATGLSICASGVLGAADPLTGQAVDGAALTSLAFETVLGPAGGTLVRVCVILFAFSTILGWEYNGETAFVYLFGEKRLPAYRAVFTLLVFLGAGQSLETVWCVSDIFNALMALPNLLSLLLLSGTAARELDAFQREERSLGGR